ncbi:AMP-binding protein [Haliangium ochraceum]|uniref:AMP-dependent synthetase and ligase n=1 Tax=Haliangium ochraceum (strain DSM 14365 / JCM 11303 / SMP-2) TaxID=502025 RepID=D0LTQ6_HALO1|nr:AMP-binding protein [Haliangium ochraceum]ACY15750.1 AMP-dependent synthetase and ligase [Haliangium ochraceum DSM 14365]
MSSPDTPARAPLDVSRAFDGKNILLIGSTGFVGKVALSMLLRHYPNVGRVYALVRPGMGNSAEERFFSKVAASPAFDPLREVWQDGYESFLREKIVPVAGDIGRPLCNFDDAQFERFAEGNGLDVIINSAGLVSFTPPLESGLRINALGAKNVLEAARRAGAGLVHISTCFVAGRRDGDVREDEPVVGYFPRQDELNTYDFSAEDEIADCLRIIDQVRAEANDRAHISHFRELAAETLRSQRRDPEDESNLRLAVARERKLWVQQRLREVGQERADHWGWTNTYTYTKSLGEQVVLDQDDVPACVVRPAIVESAVRFPFPGWNEGFNTTAPLVYLVLKGHRQIVSGDRTPLDVIPVDLVCAGVLQAAAAVIDGRHEPVYQCGSSDINPVFTSRLTELTALAVRRHFRQLADDGENPIENRIRARLEAFPVSEQRFETFSAPQVKRVATGLTRAIDKHLPRWGAPRLTATAERVKDRLGRVSEFTDQALELINLFKPFTHDHWLHFRCDNTRALNAQLTPQDQQALRWDPDAIDWRSYWLDYHFAGLQKWVFPILDDEFGPQQRSVYTHKDLMELFDATTKLHRHRVALRLLPPASDEDREPVVYTYGRVQDMALQGAAALRERGVGQGDHVMLMSENRPAWGISYFAILKAGATAVPVDAQLSLAEVENLLRASGAKVLILSTRAADRLLTDEGVALPLASAAEDSAEGDSTPPLDGRRWRRAAHSTDSASEIEEGVLFGALSRLLADRGLGEVEVAGFDDILAEPRATPAGPPMRRLGETVASLIYTSGTTGAPKGVMLTHKNFTFMAAKMSSVFRLFLHDSLLSVIPLHHTFEFSAGFLMPFVHGSSITYLDEIDADNLSAAFRESRITGMVGVPALWQLLNRRIFKTVSERGLLVQRAFEAIVDVNRRLRDKTGINIGRLLFWPVHLRLGGQLRLLISGGSALSSDLHKSFRGLGFEMLEGYGMTESSPVLTVQRIEDTPVLGSVGRALPGVDVRIDSPDGSGVGEVVAKGNNVMAGYYQNQDATDDMLRDGWLHTGDLGRMDDDGNLYIVGRRKEMILGPAGENVYPDELEELYRDSPYVKELSIVGLPSGDGETVAALVVPDYEKDEREVVRERARQHMAEVSKQLPLYKRVKIFHLWDFDLPRTSTRKVKRREVVAELQRLERALATARTAAAEAGGEGAGKGRGGKPGARDGAWVRALLAQVAQKQRAQVQPETTLADLGFDSLMFTELGVALEKSGVDVPDPAVILELQTVADVERYLAQQENATRQRKSIEKMTRNSKQLERGDDDEIQISPLVAHLGRRGLRMGLRMLYDRVLHTDVRGEAHVPPFGGYIVAANHASHLDMGLVKHALGETGDLVVALAAKDYFFEDPVRRAYFENFTNLVPMERYGSLRESLRLASDVLRDGHILLIFPEGTRSKDGVMDAFLPSLGYLAMQNRCGILPMYLAGTHDAMPKGAFLPKQREVSAHIAPFLTYEQVQGLAAGKSRSAAYRAISQQVEARVRKLAPAEYEWTLGEAGRTPAGEPAQPPSDEERS